MSKPNTRSTVTPAEPEELDVDFVIHGTVTDAAQARAVEAIRNLAAKAPRPVIFARVKLFDVASRAPVEDQLAQATLDVSGTVLRAQVAAGGMIEAINLLESRLERRLRSLSERMKAADARPAEAEPGTWRRGDLPSSRPEYFVRPTSEREIVRRKTWAGDRISITDALFDLYALDHRFFLFTDEVDGIDSIVFEADGDVRLQRLTGDAPHEEEVASLPIEIVRAPAPEMTSEDAVRRLDAGDEPFVFYRDATSGRGSVLYRRYDGHYGLIEAVD